MEAAPFRILRRRLSLSLAPENFLLPFYRRYFEHRGFRVLDAFVMPRNDEYLAYMVIQLDGRPSPRPQKIPDEFT